MTFTYLSEQRLLSTDSGTFLDIISFNVQCLIFLKFLIMHMLLKLMSFGKPLMFSLIFEIIILLFPALTGLFPP